MGLYHATAMISQEKQKQNKTEGEVGRNIKLKAKQNGSMQKQTDDITREKYKQVLLEVILAFKLKHG